MADIAKVITIIGSSPESFAKAADSAVQEAAKTLRGISGADVVTMSAVVENDRISEYRTTVNIAFAVELDPLEVAVPAQLDHGDTAAPRIVEEDRALLADHLQLVSLGQSETGVELRDHAVWEGQRASEHEIDPACTGHLLRGDALRLACQKPEAADAVAADVHQRPAVDLWKQPDVVRASGREAER